MELGGTDGELGCGKYFTGPSERVKDESVCGSKGNPPCLIYRRDELAGGVLAWEGSGAELIRNGARTEKIAIKRREGYFGNFTTWVGWGKMTLSGEVFGGMNIGRRISRNGVRTVKM